MSKVHFVLVCHCERVEWDESYSFEDMEFAVRSMIEIVAKVEDEYGIRIPLTYLPCFSHEKDECFVVKEKRDLFKELLKMGNEIGVHTHVEYDDLPSQDRFIVSDANALEKLGFPRPKTWVAGDFYTTHNTIRELEKGKYAVDGSVVPLEGKFYHGSQRQFKIDYSKCKTLSPYHPSRNDISLLGDSSIVELPVTGYLPELLYWDQHFPLTEEKLEERLLSKWQKREETGVDVFHIFWHPQDLWCPHDAWYPQEAGKPKKIDYSLLECVENLLRMASELEDIVFSTAYRAAMDWDESQ
jgi:hypothetical protein